MFVSLCVHHRRCAAVLAHLTTRSRLCLAILNPLMPRLRTPVVQASARSAAAAPQQEAAAQGGPTPAERVEPATAREQQQGRPASPQIEKPIEVMAYEACRDVMEALRTKYSGPLQVRGAGTTGGKTENMVGLLSERRGQQAGAARHVLPCGQTCPCHACHPCRCWMRS